MIIISRDDAVYPVCFCWSFSASKDDLEEMETTEADGELQIITECWVEPQCGVIVNSSPKLQHFDGLDYRQLAEAVSESLLLYAACVESNHFSTTCMCHGLSLQTV